jgi:hypothetical protein
MLDSPVLRSNAHLMDKMFTCLSYASSGIPQLDASAVASAALKLTARQQQLLRHDQAQQQQQQQQQQTSGNVFEPMVAALTTSGATSSTTTDAANSSETTKPEEINEIGLNNETAVLNKQIELVVNVLKNKQCTQEGLQQAYTLLNNLSKINSATRNMIIKHLLKGKSKTSRIYFDKKKPSKTRQY